MKNIEIENEKIFNESDYMYSDYENGLVEDNEYKYKVRRTWDGLRTYEGKLIRSKRKLDELKDLHNGKL